MNSPAQRLRLARKAAGFVTAQDAAKRFSWHPATYTGHENGSRGISARMLPAYAKSFKVEMQWLLEGTGSMRAATEDEAKPLRASQPRRPPRPDDQGFDDSEATPFVAASPSAARLVAMIAGALSGGARHVQSYIAQRDYTAFAIQKGDLLIIGTPQLSRDGDLVIATLSDMNTALSVTVVRQRLGDRLVPPLHGAVDAESRLEPGILGTVISVVRSPAFA